MSKRPRSSSVTAAELIGSLESDPDWIKQREAREEEHQERVRALTTEAIPLLQDLERHGIQIGSLSHLDRVADSDIRAIPVLISHLNYSHEHGLRACIASALCTPLARSGWRELVDQFRSDPYPTIEMSSSKWILGLALGRCATDAEIADVITLFRDSSQGRDRLPLIPALLRSKTPVARQCLLELAADPQIGREVGKALRRKRWP